MSKKLFMHFVSAEAMLAAGLTQVTGIGFGAAGLEGDPFLTFNSPFEIDAMAAYDQMNKLVYPLLGKINSANIDANSGVEKVHPRPVEAVKGMLLFTAGTATQKNVYFAGAAGQKYHCEEAEEVASWDDIVAMSASGVQQIAALAVGGVMASVVIAGIRKN